MCEEGLLGAQCRWSYFWILLSWILLIISSIAVIFQSICSVPSNILLFIFTQVCVFSLTLLWVTHEFGKPFCLASCTFTLQSLENVHFCFKPPCVKRTSDKEIPFHFKMRMVSSQDMEDQFYFGTGVFLYCTKSIYFMVANTLILEKYRRKVANVIRINVQTKS